MEYESLGDPSNPILICVPGLLGGPENFRAMLDGWAEAFRVFVLDPNKERRDEGLSGLTVESIREVSYDSTSEDIAVILDREEGGARGAYLTGISLGGKIVYDFASKFPQRFLGGLITDVGPGSFQHSELFRFVDGIVQTLDRNKPWGELKAELQRLIPDRSLRSLIQSQLFYPTKAPPAEWKTGMRNFRSMLQSQGIDEQFNGLEKVDARLAADKRRLHVLHASSYSGISHDTLPRLRALASVTVQEVPDSTHFLHITHKRLIQDCVLGLICDDPSQRRAL
jgi:pimeloyl-ACP methyl ester carboxylesterase